MKFDYHTHHNRCGHATGTVRDYVIAAIEKGLQVIGISDHTPAFALEEDLPRPEELWRRVNFLHTWMRF